MGTDRASHLTTDTGNLMSLLFCVRHLTAQWHDLAKGSVIGCPSASLRAGFLGVRRSGLSMTPAVAKPAGDADKLPELMAGPVGGTKFRGADVQRWTLTGLGT